MEPKQMTIQEALEAAMTALDNIPLHGREELRRIGAPLAYAIDLVGLVVTELQAHKKPEPGKPDQNKNAVGEPAPVNT